MSTLSLPHWLDTLLEFTSWTHWPHFDLHCTGKGKWMGCTVSKKEGFIFPFYYVSNKNVCWALNTTVVFGDIYYWLAVIVNYIASILQIKPYIYSIWSSLYMLSWQWCKWPPGGSSFHPRLYELTCEETAAVWFSFLWIGFINTTLCWDEWSVCEVCVKCVWEAVGCWVYVWCELYLSIMENSLIKVRGGRSCLISVVERRRADLMIYTIHISILRCNF